MDCFIFTSCYNSIVITNIYAIICEKGLTVMLRAATIVQTDRQTDRQVKSAHFLQSIYPQIEQAKRYFSNDAIVI